MDAFSSWEPGALAEEVRADLLRHFTPTEIVEMTLSVIRWRTASKLLVALRLEPESMAVTIA